MSGDGIAKPKIAHFIPNLSSQHGSKQAIAFRRGVAAIPVVEICHFSKTEPRHAPCGLASESPLFEEGHPDAEDHGEEDED
jgi:hypothetical protein